VLRPDCRRCTAERNARYRADHRDEIARCKARYYADHREAIIDEKASYRAGRRRELATNQRAYHAAHRDECVAYSAQYHAEHMEQARGYRRSRRARVRGADGLYTDQDVRAQLDRQRGRCYWQASDECKSRRGKLTDVYHADHVVPLALGGSNWPSNIVVSCPSCNEHKHATHPMDFAGVML